MFRSYLRYRISRAEGSNRGVSMFDGEHRRGTDLVFGNGLLVADDTSDYAGVNLHARTIKNPINRLHTRKRLAEHCPAIR